VAKAVLNPEDGRPLNCQQGDREKQSEANAKPHAGRVSSRNRARAWAVTPAA
jgi:hypothetical protein